MKINIIKQIVANGYNSNLIEQLLSKKIYKPAIAETYSTVTGNPSHYEATTYEKNSVRKIKVL